MAARPIIALLVVGGVAHANAPITGGTPSSESAVVALSFGDTLVCSGTLIAPQAVLTAGHCVGNAPLPDVAVGDALVGAAHHVSLAALVHPAFDRQTLDHDLAIVIVEPTLGVDPLPYGSTLEGAGSGSQIEVVG